jgi:hypothetical protein
VKLPVRDPVSWLIDTAEDMFELRWPLQTSPPELASQVRAFAEQRTSCWSRRQLVLEDGETRGEHAHSAVFSVDREVPAPANDLQKCSPKVQPIRRISPDMCGPPAT